MNRSKFYQVLAKRVGVSTGLAKEITLAFTDVIEEELVEGGTVNLSGFGKFSLSRRPARRGWNPRTQEHMTIAGYTTPKFTAGTNLKKKIRTKFN